MPAARTLTKAQRLAREKAIIKDLKAGKLSYRQIAAKHKVSLPTVNSKARKAGISRSRRGPAGLAKTATRRKKRTTRRTPAMRARTRTTARKKTRRKATRRTAARTPRRSGAFQEQFRELIMRHYPNISLRAFDKLTTAVERVLK